MMDMFKNHEQQAIAFNEAQRKAVDLKKDYYNARKNGDDLEPIRSQLAQLIGETKFPTTFNITEQQADARLLDWINLNMGDQNNFSEGSKLGKLFDSMKGKAQNEATKDNDSLNRIDERFKTLMADAKRFLETAKNNGDLSIKDQATQNLIKLVGQESADKLLRGEIHFNDTSIGGELGQMADEYDKKMDALQNSPLITKERGAESSPETQKKGHAARFAEFMRNVFAEAGKLVLSAKENFNKTAGNWWEKAKGLFKKENKQESGEQTAQEKGEFWFNASKNVGKLGHETARLIRESWARGGKEAEQLKELIATDKDLAGQLGFLGINIVANALHLNPIGFALGGVGKFALDEMALARAEEAGKTGEYIQKRFFQATDSKGFAERNAQKAAAAETPEAIAEYNKLKGEVGKAYQEAVEKSKELQAKIKKDKKTLRKKDISKNQRTALEANLRENTETLGQLSEEIAKIESSESFQRLVALEAQLPQTVASEKELTIIDQAGKHLFTALRLTGQGLATYSAIAKKMLVDLQGSGNDVEDFIKKSVDKENARNVDAIVTQVNKLLEGLTVAKIKERSAAGRKERKQLKNDALQIRDLISSLIDLGMFGDIIPRNIGHKQINAFFGRTEMEENKLIRDPELLAELRTKVMAAVKGVATAMDKMDWQGIDGGLYEVLDDINYMGAHTEQWIQDRQREMARRMTAADIIGIFANGAVVYAGTHAGELTEGMKKIVDSFNHEHQLGTNPDGLRDMIDNHSVGNTTESGTNSNTNGDGPSTETTGGTGTRVPPEVNNDTLDTTTGPETTDTTTDTRVLRTDSNTEIQYRDAQGRIMYENGRPVGINTATGETTTEGAMGAMATETNATGTLNEQLYDDLNAFNIDTHNIPNGLVNYVLSPLAENFNLGTFSPEELQRLSDMYAANFDFYNRGGDLTTLANEIIRMRNG